MGKPLQIGITGGIGSGKSLVCKIFNALGTPTYDADSRAKMVMTTDGILVEAIKKNSEFCRTMRRVFLTDSIWQTVYLVNPISLSA